MIQSARNLLASLLPSPQLNDLGRRMAWKPLLAATIAIALLLNAESALAHHPFGGTTPDNWLTGFLSGLGHPVIGIDHLAFVIAAGCIAVLYAQRGWVVPVTFTLMTVLGTLVHLGELNLPVPELVISASVLCFGVLLALPQKMQLPMGAIAFLASLAGVFHGFAYGEAIFGAEMGPLVAYLAGFALVQLGIAIGVYKLAGVLLAGDQATEQSRLPLRFAGFTLGGIGFAFLSGVILG